MTLRLNNDYKIGDKVVIGHNISAAFSAKTNDDPAVVGQAYRLSPIITPYNENGDFSDSQNSSTGNPLATIAYLNNSVRDDRITGNAFLDWTIIDGRNTLFLLRKKMNKTNYRRIGRGILPGYGKIH